ncbi:uncharacterized protein LOC123552547 isoform X2 [Mercenaria mercenaria]|uniref:uncharacterized protein LOC123552547 isoform X2 n=1 Tax=Mercenaria mercenaria TaxID=6596 RepID=UPI00234F3920|nr:uncharacterized protein LOC123552547 isoform X2 [Mercenaria mercenaria]
MKRSMYIDRLLVCLIRVLLCIIQVVNICSTSEVIMTSTVFIDTVNVPTMKENTCTCTVSPASSNVLVLLTYRIAPLRHEKFNMQFKLNDIVLNKIKLRGNTTLTETTELAFNTSAEFSTEGACLILDTADVTKFNISCESSISTLTKWSVHSTLATMTTVDGDTNTTTDNGNDVDISSIAIGGAVGGVVGLVLLIAVIICCRRKSRTKKHKHAAETSQNGNNEAPGNEEDDYYMTENPMYNLTDIPQYSRINQNEDDLKGTEENDDRLLPNEYEILPDPPNDPDFPLTQTCPDQETK